MSVNITEIALASFINSSEEDLSKLENMILDFESLIPMRIKRDKRKVTYNDILSKIIVAKSFLSDLEKIELANQINSALETLQTKLMRETKGFIEHHEERICMICKENFKRVITRRKNGNKLVKVSCHCGSSTVNESLFRGQSSD